MDLIHLDLLKAIKNIFKKGDPFYFYKPKLQYYKSLDDIVPDR